MGEDIRSNKCLFVSHCILAQCVMANGIVKKFPGPVTPVLEFCIKNDINIMQMPCPETLTKMGGVGRTPHGKKWYEENGLRETAKMIANGQVEYMKKLVGGGMDILGIVGVDFSPACAVNYLNKGRSIAKGMGIYIEELKRELRKNKLDIKMIGISQRWDKKMNKDLNDLIKEEPVEG